MTRPFKALTTRQEEVADLLGRGWPYKRIASHLAITTDTVATHVTEIAYRLDNPDDLPVGTLVMLWAAHRLWLREHKDAA